MAYARKATGSTAIIRNQNGLVLLLRRAYPPWDWILPGGIAEQDESPADTVRREVQEEIGLSVRIDALVGVYYQADHRAGEFIHFVIACTLDGGGNIRPNPAEVAEHGWFAADALPAPMSASTRRRVTGGLARSKPVQVVTLPPRSEPPV